MHGIDDLRNRKRLGQEMHLIDRDALPKRFLGIARHEQDRQARHALAHFHRHAWAVEIGHHHIADDEIERPAVAQPVEPVLAIARGHHGKALARQRALGDRAHHVLVLDQQQPRMAPLAGIDLGGLAAALLDRAAAIDRKIDREGRALAGFGIDEDIAARLLDDAVHRRQAKPCALADILGGEERLEDARLDVGGHAGAAVLDEDRAVIVDRQDIAVHRAHVRRRHFAGADGERSPRRALGEHRIAAIDCEVDDHLFELAGVSTDGAEIAVMLHLEHDLLADQPF